MALLVCYYESEEDCDWSNKAIYLNQSSYEFLFNKFSSKKESLLNKIVMLGYSKELFLSFKELEVLLIELGELQKSKLPVENQLADFQRIIVAAINNNVKLAIAGDMYPDLSKEC